MSRSYNLYFHSSCFDGLVSAVMTLEFLQHQQGWTLNDLIPVNYDIRADWLSRDLLSPCAVVDFLYHPQAEFWADHHSTSFLSEDARRDFENRRGAWIVYDDRADSCARLLRNHFAEYFGFADPRYEQMVEWADKIDSARYASVDDAILGDAPALRIRASLAAGNGPDFSKELVQELRNRTLDEVAELPVVVERAQQVRKKIAAGLDRFARAAELREGDIIVFDITSRKEDMISRYAPYYFFPQARYSVGVVRSSKTAKITAMRNPWREFPSVHLGTIFEKFGGGGHERVGSVIISGSEIQSAGSILTEITDQIRNEERLKRVDAHVAKI